MIMSEKQNIDKRIIEIAYLSKMLFAEIRNNNTYFVNSGRFSEAENYMINDACKEMEDIANLFVFLSRNMRALS